MNRTAVCARLAAMNAVIARRAADAEAIVPFSGGSLLNLG